MQQIDFYCKKCRKTMKMSYVVSGDDEALVLPNMIVKCHTNKCTRAVVLKKYTEKMIILSKSKDNVVYI